MLLKVKQVSTFREVQKISESVLRFYFSLGCSPLWPNAEQRGAMNPTPATKTIKRLYYYSVAVFLIKKTSFKYSQRLIEVLPAIIRTVQNSIEKVWHGF